MFHSLADHKQQQPDEFCHITELDERVIVMNKQINDILNVNAVEIVKVGCFHLPVMHTFLIILYHLLIF